MAILFIALAVGAAYLSDWSVISIVIVVLSVWSNGVLMNYRHEDAQLAPDWAATVSMLSVLASVVLGAYALAF